MSRAGHHAELRFTPDRHKALASLDDALLREKSHLSTLITGRRKLAAN
jgi:hypothetical protein